VDFTLYFGSTCQRTRLGTKPVGIGFGLGGKSEGSCNKEGYPRPEGGPRPRDPNSAVGPPRA